MFILLQTENTPQKMRVSVKDLIRLPKANFTKQTPKRRVTSTAPEYHLTGEKSIKFIEDADKRKKQKKQKKKNSIKLKLKQLKRQKQKKGGKGKLLKQSLAREKLRTIRDFRFQARQIKRDMLLPLQFLHNQLIF